ncbi:hypothetical protein ACWY4P_53815 (plasmid) [Streptomyces sp. LZ34]
MEQKSRVRFNPRSTTTNQPSTTWPEDVIARYLTVAGATVDLSFRVEDGIPYAPTSNGADVRKTVNVTAVASCVGCTEEETATRLGTFRSAWEKDHTPNPVASPFLTEVRRWAQAHAEKCRAIPRPTT